MAGAPRTASVWIASTTASTVSRRQWTRSSGSRRWSMMTGASASQAIDAIGMGFVRSGVRGRALKPHDAVDGRPLVGLGPPRWSKSEARGSVSRSRVLAPTDRACRTGLAIDRDTSGTCGRSSWDWRWYRSTLGAVECAASPFQLRQRRSQSATARPPSGASSFRSSVVRNASNDGLTSVGSSKSGPNACRIGPHDGSGPSPTSASAR